MFVEKQLRDFCCCLTPDNSTHISFRFKQLTGWQMMCRRAAGSLISVMRLGGVGQEAEVRVGSWVIERARERERLEMRKSQSIEFYPQLST